MESLTARLLEILPPPFVFSNEECLRLEEETGFSVVWEPDIFAEFATLVMGLAFFGATAVMSYSNVRFEFQHIEIGSYRITTTIRIGIGSASQGKTLLTCLGCITLEWLGLFGLKFSLLAFFGR